MKTNFPIKINNKYKDNKQLGKGRTQMHTLKNFFTKTKKLENVPYTLHTISRALQLSFLKVQHNIKNWYHKVIELLQNETKIVIRKCDRGLLQSVSGTTKCIRYYKVWQYVITKCDGLLLKNFSSITKCDSFYKVRHNTRD